MNFRHKYSSIWTWSIVFSLTAFIVQWIKTPTALWRGRLWAEEGAYFVDAMWSRSFLEATGFLYQGTLQLLPNWAAYAAVHLPIDYLPAAPIIIALLFLGLFAVLFAVWARDEGVNLGAALLALTAFMLSANSYEVTANSTNLQWICSYCCLIILLLKKERVRSCIGFFVPLFILCGLTGVPSVMLAPAFLVKSFLTKDRNILYLGLILSLAAIGQGALILSHSLPGREFALNPLEIGYIGLAQTMGGEMVTLKGVRLLLAPVRESGILMRLAQFLGLAAALAGLVFLARQARPSQPRWIVSLLVVTWLGVTYLNIAGALGPSTALRNGDGGRYFLFGELCFLILLLWVSKSDKAWIGRGATFLLAWACVTGVIFRIGGVRPLIANQGPAWGAQISACRAEPNNPCRVRIFPAYYPQDQWWLSVPAERLKQ